MWRGIAGTFLLLAGCTAAQPTPSPADAAAAGAAIAAFGLVGTWSADCALTPAQGRIRTTYAVTAGAAPTVAAESKLLRTDYTVRRAERIGDDLLHLTIEATRIEDAAHVVSTPSGIQYDEIIEKTGARYRVTQSQRIGGDVLIENGLVFQANPPIPSPLMAKCAAP